MGRQTWIVRGGQEGEACVLTRVPVMGRGRKEGQGSRAGTAGSEDGRGSGAQEFRQPLEAGKVRARILS